MTAVSSSEARTNFSKLLERAHQGEEIIITHRGEPYARLVPLEPELAKSQQEIFARIRARARRMGVKATPEEIIAWKHEGHRY